MNEFVARNGLISLASVSITGSMQLISGSVSIGGNPPSSNPVFQVTNINVSPGVGGSGFISSFGGSFTEAGSGNHDINAVVNIFQPTIVGGSSTVGSYACLYIGTSPAGTVNEDNYTAWFGGKVKIQSKLIGTGSGATIAAGAAAGTTPTVSIAGGDLAGAVTITAGSAAPTGTVATITFTSAFKNAPIIILSAGDIDASAVVTRIWTTSTTTTFTIESNTNLANGTQYVWNYTVIGQ